MAQHHSRTARLCLAPLALAASLALAGCETSGITDRIQDAVHDFNPFDTKKRPLPGDRKPVFPEGVPGVQQGVPAELMQGYQPPADEEAARAAAAAEAEEKKQAEPKPKPKPKPRVAKRAPAQDAAAEERTGSANPAPRSVREEPRSAAPRNESAGANSPWPEPRQQQSQQPNWPEPNANRAGNPGEHPAWRNVR